MKETSKNSTIQYRWRSLRIRPISINHIILTSICDLGESVLVGRIADDGGCWVIHSLFTFYILFFPHIFLPLWLVIFCLLNILPREERVYPLLLSRCFKFMFVFFLANKKIKWFVSHPKPVNFYPLTRNILFFQPFWFSPLSIFLIPGIFVRFIVFLAHRHQGYLRGMHKVIGTQLCRSLKGNLL